MACEYSGRVRDAFKAKGHETWSCDLLPTESPGSHLQGNALDHLEDGWDMMLAFPPCTHLATTGARWFHLKRTEQEEALTFFKALLEAPIPRIAIENPVGIVSTRLRKPDQIIQPWQHGHGETKRTCLWLKGLPLLKPSEVVEGRYPRSWLMPGSKDQAKKRSLTYLGIAKAMADQWGGQGT